MPPGLAALALVALAACGGSDGGGPTGPSGPTRGYRMGFSALPPRNDLSLVVPVIDLWSRRADAAIAHVSVPWAELIAGSEPDVIVEATQVGLAQLYTQKGLPLTMVSRRDRRPRPHASRPPRWWRRDAASPSRPFSSCTDGTWPRWCAASAPSSSASPQRRT